jgi:hypothetical protein
MNGEKYKMQEQERIRCAIVRGSTSKGVFLMKNDLPKDPTIRDKVILAIFGSPDLRQIDGLGGADPLTSKVAIIGPPTCSGADVDYLFGQVGISKGIIDYNAFCGNIVSGVGPFAIDEGLIQAKEPKTTVRIHNINYDKIMTAEVPVKDGKAAVEGDFKIDGVPGTGAEIKLDYSVTAGWSTGRGLLPTGNAKDTIRIDGRDIDFSILDISNPVVFCRARDIGLDGTETPDKVDSNKAVCQLLESIRRGVSEKIFSSASKLHLVIYVNEPKAYTNYMTNSTIKAEEIDILCHGMFMGKIHKTLPLAGIPCTGAAAKIPNTIVNEMISEAALKREEVRIGHPAGIVRAETVVERGASGYVLKRAIIGRTARRIMDGYVYVRRNVLNDGCVIPITP